MLKVLFLLALPGMLAGGLAVGTRALVEPEPTRTQWVVWGGRAFSEPGGLTEWLRARGLSYRQWAKRHPSAAARLEGRPLPETLVKAPAETTGVRSARPQPEPKPRPQARSEPAGEALGALASDSGSGGGSVLPIVTATALGLAAALLLLAALPVIVIYRVGWAMPIHEHRLEIAAAAASIAVGVGLANLF